MNAYLYSPTNVSVDATGNVYIADYLNNRIRKVSTNYFYVMSRYASILLHHYYIIVCILK